MKKYLVIIIFIVFFIGCQKHDNTTTPVTKTETIEGIISADKILDVNTIYTLKGQVYVKNNSTLTIPAGVTVLVEKYDLAGSKSVLVITKGSKLIINGTKENPVIFTSAAQVKAPGDWGAIIIEGKAPTNVILGHTAGLSETPDSEYGGTVADDNSGSISFLRLEYCGGINPPQEDEWVVDKASGLCLEGVGSGTKIDNVMVSHSNDDGFQFVGGTVNATHLISFNNGDDDFDFDLGYTGKLQFIIGYHIKASSAALRANGFESYNDEVPTLKQPLTRPVVSNMTLIGPEGVELVKTNLNQGVYSRKGTRLAIRNSVVAEFPQGGLMVCNKTRPVLLNGNSLDPIDRGSEFKYNLVHSDYIERTFSWDKDYAVLADPELKEFATNSDNQNTLIAQSRDLKLKIMYSDSGPDLTPLPGSPALLGTHFEGPDFSTFFIPVTYKGAIGDQNWAASSNWAVWK